MENKTTDKQRLQFDFSNDAVKRLEDLKEKLEAPTKADVIRTALKVLEWFANEIDENYVINIEDKDGKSVYRIPAKMLLK